MAQDDLESLKGLHQDLIALSQARLPEIDRLCADLEAHIEAFRGLLDKPLKNDASRGVLNSGKALGHLI